MPINGWSGPDPVNQNEGVGVNLELAARMVANNAINITGVRVWAENTVAVADRAAHIWRTSDQVLLKTIPLDEELPTSGWTTYQLDTPLGIPRSTKIDVSYMTTQYYGVLGDFTADFPRLSADNSVTVSLGHYISLLENYPINPSSQFYGIDIIYDRVTSIGAGANEEWVSDILDAVVSDVQRSGYFDRVNKHEPKRQPGHGLTAAVWMQRLAPIPQGSGLASTSAVLVFTVRLYMRMTAEPIDMIDPRMMKAASNIMRRYHDDFDFDGLIRNVDLLGQSGVGMESNAGYLELGGTMYRIIDINVPCIVNDVWEQVHS